MSLQLTRSILQTLAYADVFSFPLASREVWFYLISKDKTSQTQVQESLRNLLSKPNSPIRQQGGFFYLVDMGHLIEKRRKQEKTAVQKNLVVQKALLALKMIPSVALVGLTGKTALGIADPDEDVDLLIVARKGTLWWTRLLATVALDLLGMRRKPGPGPIKDRICLNMFLDESALDLPKRERDLYAAHEVIQMQPVLDRGSVYQRFLKANRWVEEYLVNGYESRIRKEEKRARNQEGGSESLLKSSLFLVLNSFFRVIEPLARSAQLCYMHSRVTNEVLTKEMIRFHPQDAREWVIPEYGKRLRKLGLDLRSR
jgi:hypothetical protein